MCITKRMVDLTTPEMLRYSVICLAKVTHARTGGRVEDSNPSNGGFDSHFEHHTTIGTDSRRTTMGTATT